MKNGNKFSFLGKQITVLFAVIMAAGMIGCGAKTGEAVPPVQENTPEEAVSSEENTSSDENEEIADFDEEHPNNELVLRGSSYTGLTNIRKENNDDGTYYYEDITSDGITVITNMSSPNSQRDGQDMDAYAINFVCALIDNDARVDDSVIDDALTEKFTYPVYKATWESGANEDTKKATGVVVLTDLYTYYYGFACPIDFYEENEEFYKEELADLSLSSVDEERNIDSDGELMDYYGKNIDDLMPDFPDLEISAQEGIYDKNGAQYIDKEEEFDGMLSGPSFDVDSKFNIVGITYSGRRFTLAGLCAAMTMDDAIATAKENGWTFSDVDFAHGTAQYVANYTKDDMILTIISTDEGEFGKSEESDLTGSVETVSVSKK